MIFRKFYRYLFPKPTKRQLVPLLARHWSSTNSRHGKPPDTLKFDIWLMKVHRIASTDDDAYRRIKHHKGQKSAAEIIRLEKRKRWRTNRFQRALKRLIEWPGRIW